MPVRTILAVAIAALLSLAASVALGDEADELANLCHASSSYDLTLTSDALIFERAAPAPQRVEWRSGVLRTQGVVVALDTEGRDRLTMFDHELRALLPRVKAVAERGIELVLVALRAQMDELAPSTPARMHIEQQLAQAAATLKQRIARSSSTREWSAPVLQAQVEAVAGEVARTLAEDTAQRSLAAALEGDAQTALALPAQVGDLAAQVRPRIARQLRQLHPQVQALCPALRRLAELQQGVRDAQGYALDLLVIESPPGM